MISSRHVVLVALAVGLLVVPLSGQQRQKKLGPADFEPLLEQVKTAYNDKKFMLCIKYLQQEVQICSEQLQAAIRAARPNTPTGFKFVEKQKQDMVNALGGNLGSAIGFVTELEYRQESGSGSVRAKVMADSTTMATMLDAQFRMAALNPKLEVVTYNAHKALFEKKANGDLKMQLLIDGKHYVEVTARGLSEDDFFKMFNQEFVDRLAKVLA